MLIDDLSRPDGVSALGTPWRVSTDRVMGGLSEASLDREEEGGEAWLRLRGEVRLDNDGGFVQAGLDLHPEGKTLDLSRFDGIKLVVCGNFEEYGLHLRTLDCVKPWQSYRASFSALPIAQTLRVPFDSFEPHRVRAPLDLSRCRRLSLIAIGRPFQADLGWARIATYGKPN